MERMGSMSKKILLLLIGGASLSLTRRPDQYFRIVRKIAKEWKKINDGTVNIVLTDNGKKKILKYDLDKIKVKRPIIWDGIWRLVIFDIPEDERRGRVALVEKLKELGFYPMQKSVFIYPYECKNEIDFITELFDLSPYVRFLRVKNTDIDLDLKNRFRLR